MIEITRKTRVMTLVSDADYRQVLDWYGLPTNDRSMLRLTLEDFCLEHDVDVEDLMAELMALDEDGEDDWLFVG